MRFYCPPKCKNGNIVKCGEDAKFSDKTTFTNETTYPTCPRFMKEGGRKKPDVHK